MTYSKESACKSSFTDTPVSDIPNCVFENIKNKLDVSEAITHIADNPSQASLYDYIQIVGFIGFFVACLLIVSGLLALVESTSQDIRKSYKDKHMN